MRLLHVRNTCVISTTYTALTLCATYCTYQCNITGLVYSSYLAGHCRQDSSEGAFRALSHGYIHYASSRLKGIVEVNINHLLYFHVRCTL